jgi:hypothetical protein
MGFTITAVTPLAVGVPGGTRIRIVGTFAAERETEFHVHVGPAGTSADQRCYSGVRGQGFVLLPKSDTELWAYLPNLEPSAGSPYAVTVRKADGSEEHKLMAQITVLPPQYYSGVFSIRNVMPPNWDAGSRNFSTLPAVTP